MQALLNNRLINFNLLAEKKYGNQILLFAIQIIFILLRIYEIKTKQNKISKYIHKKCIQTMHYNN